MCKDFISKTLQTQLNKTRPIWIAHIFSGGKVRATGQVVLNWLKQERACSWDDWGFGKQSIWWFTVPSRFGVPGPSPDSSCIARVEGSNTWFISFSLHVSVDRVGELARPLELRKVNLAGCSVTVPSGGASLEI